MSQNERRRRTAGEEDGEASETALPLIKKTGGVFSEQQRPERP